MTAHSPRDPSLPALLRRLEDSLAALIVLAMIALPLAEIAARRLLGQGIPGSIPFVQHLTLWVAFVGAAIAARDDRLLALATGTFLPEGRVRRAAQAFASAVAAFVTGLLLSGAIELVRLEREAGTLLALGIPVWVAQAILPVAFGLVAWRLVRRAGRGWLVRGIALAAAAAALALSGAAERLGPWPAWPAVVTIVAAGLLGAPLFAVIGGAAGVLFLGSAIPPAAILVETYQLSVNPTLPAIPLFTVAGFLLAEGRAPERLLRVFRAWFGWLPGGTAIVCILVSAFFTVFTGGSGVTILALGGVLLPLLLKDGYGERFSLGLLTSAGSLGLLFPPALPLILYGIVSQTRIEDLFAGGIMPGLVGLLLVAAYGVREGRRRSAGTVPFAWREAWASLWAARWEMLLPALVLAVIFGGWATLVEAAALAAGYALVVQVAASRDVAPRDAGRVLADAVTTIGGVLVILGVAVGLTNYLVDANVPGRLLAWTQTYVESKLVFLLGLNVFLLVVGCLMDIYSATFVVVPLIAPLGAAYGIHPVHLGIVFIANLELGYLTPPVGLNLFLASYRFRRPLLEVAAASLPLLAIRGVGVLLITYAPWLTLALLGLVQP
jgi:tripartite ATP-independent transporter DctM subunit